MLYAKFSKCKFLLESLEFLGYIVSGDGTRVDTKKLTQCRIDLDPYLRLILRVSWVWLAIIEDL